LEKIMFRKSTILSLAAAATLGVLAISTTSASAFHFGGGGMRAGGVHFSAARVAGPHFAFHRNFAFRRIVRVGPPRHHWHWRWHFARHPYWIAPVVATGVAAATYAATPTCNCLTKSYTQDGAVVFKDLCTKEMAMNPPADAAPQAPATLGYAQPQMPMQQGYLQPTQ
jgi:hypothetical protein